MKIKILSVISLMLVFTLTLTSCGGGGGGGGGTPADNSGGNTGPTSTVFESEDGDGNTYKLEIKDSSARAVYTPKTGDNYVLTITYTDSTTKTSKGTVKVNAGSFELTPKKSDGTAGTPFTVTIVPTIAHNL